MIPEFDEKGQLPPGIHDADWDEFATRFGTTEWRRRLLDGLKGLVRHLKSVGCHALYVNGSFVTDKRVPEDYDACWDPIGVEEARVDPVLWALTDTQFERMVDKYGRRHPRRQQPPARAARGLSRILPARPRRRAQGHRPAEAAGV